MTCKKLVYKYINCAQMENMPEVLSGIVILSTVQVKENKILMGIFFFKHGHAHGVTVRFVLLLLLETLNKFKAAWQPVISLIASHAYLFCMNGVISVSCLF